MFSITNFNRYGNNEPSPSFSGDRHQLDLADISRVSIIPAPVLPITITISGVVNIRSITDQVSKIFSLRYGAIVKFSCNVPDGINIKDPNGNTIEHGDLSRTIVACDENGVVTIADLIPEPEVQTLEEAASAENLNEYGRSDNHDQRLQQHDSSASSSSPMHFPEVTSSASAATSSSTLEAAIAQNTTADLKQIWDEVNPRSIDKPDNCEDDAQYMENYGMTKAQFEATSLSEDSIAITAAPVASVIGIVSGDDDEAPDAQILNSEPIYSAVTFTGESSIIDNFVSTVGQYCANPAGSFLTSHL